MPDEPNIPETSKPWWRSTTLQGLAVMVLTLILQHAKLNVPGLDGDVSAIVDLVFQIVGAVMVAVGRVKASKTLTGSTSAKAGN